MTLQQVKDELEDFFVRNNMLHEDCIQNSLMLIWHWGLKPYMLQLVGHTIVACPERKLVIDPSVGCIWECPKLNLMFNKELLNGKKPDYYLSWYRNDNYRFWWDYSHKYNESVKNDTITEEWDIAIEARLISFHSKHTVLNMGKFSDYMR